MQVPENKDQKEINIAIDVNFLKNASEMEVLEKIAENSELRPLIIHPTLSSFILLKWMRYSLIFYLNLVIFGLLTSILVTYITLVNMGWWENLNIIKGLSWLAIAFIAARELFQLCLTRLNYFKSSINWFELFFIVFAILSLSCTENVLKIQAFTILLATLEFLHLIGQLPFLSLSTSMVIFRKVSINYLKTMFLYVFLLVSFALAFFVLSSGKKENKGSPTEEPPIEEEVNEKLWNFGLPIYGILKIFVMLLGEIDAASLALPAKSPLFCAIFVAFVFLVPIVLFNVLNGLAVDDIQKIKAEGELTDLVERVKVLIKYEKICSGKVKILESFKKRVTIFPNILPEGRIEVTPSKKFAIVQLEKESGNGCCRFSCNQLDIKIGKKLRDVLEERKEKKLREEEEREIVGELKKLAEDIKLIRSELKDLREKNKNFGE